MEALLREKLLWSAINLNPFTPNISLVILLTAWHKILNSKNLVEWVEEFGMDKLVVVVIFLYQ